MNEGAAYDIPFNKPFVVGKELHYVSESVLLGHIGGDGPYISAVAITYMHYRHLTVPTGHPAPTPTGAEHDPAIR